MNDKAETTTQPMRVTTLGEPLVMHARARRAELRAALDRTGDADERERTALAAAIAAVDLLLTGDTSRLTDATAADLNRWLTSTKHLGLLAAPPTNSSR